MHKLLLGSAAACAFAMPISSASAASIFDGVIWGVETSATACISGAECNRKFDEDRLLSISSARAAASYAWQGGDGRAHTVGPISSLAHASASLSRTTLSAFSQTNFIPPVTENGATVFGGANSAGNAEARLTDYLAFIGPDKFFEGTFSIRISGNLSAVESHAGRAFFNYQAALPGGASLRINRATNDSTDIVELSPGCAALGGAFYRCTARLETNLAQPVQLLMGVQTDGKALADFSHTAYFDMSLPEGYSFTSASGVFLSQPAGAIPEPATWAMLILGFGLLGAAMRRRGRAAPALAFN